MTQSRIDRPKQGSRVPGGMFSFGGVAWAPNIGIEKVELSVDGGPWEEAELADPLSKASWVLWKLDYDLPAGEHEVVVRATDATGYTQTDAIAPPAPSGATGWHTIEFSAS